MNSLYSKHFEILCYRIIRPVLFSVPLLSDRLLLKLKSFINKAFSTLIFLTDQKFPVAKQTPFRSGMATIRTF